MDEYSHRLANLLVGNSEQEATLEMTLSGPRLEFTQDTLIGICGGDFAPTLDGSRCRRRGRCYCARDVCWTSEPAAWAAALTWRWGEGTMYRSSWGARALTCVGVLAVSADALFAVATSFPRVKPPPTVTLACAVNSMLALCSRIRGGPSTPTPRSWHTAITASISYLDGTAELFTEDSREQFLGVEYRIATDSDRMGYRLEGPSLALKEPAEILPEAVTFGSIQVPPDGRPIVLMANRQTTGGYPRVGEVSTVDLPLLAQLPPGDTLRFEPIKPEDSQRLYLQRDHDLGIMREALRMRMKQ